MCIYKKTGLGRAKEIIVSAEPGIIPKLSLHRSLTMSLRFHTGFMESLTMNGQMG